jgi:hypothetical protein
MNPTDHNLLHELGLKGPLSSKTQLPLPPVSVAPVTQPNTPNNTGTLFPLSQLVPDLDIEPTLGPSTGLYIYFIKDTTTGRIKIGSSVDVERRIRALRAAAKNVNSPGVFEIMATMRGELELERSIQKQFVEHRHDAEWFHPHAVLLSFIQNTATPYTTRLPRLELPRVQDDVGIIQGLSALKFDGDQLECAVVNGEPFVTVISICRPFGKVVDANLSLLGGWSRTLLSRVRDAQGVVRDVRLLHADHVAMFIARLSQRGMTPEVAAKHARYLRECQRVLGEHFKRYYLLKHAAPSLATPSVPALAAPQGQAAPPVATLSAVMVAFTSWVKEGKLSQDLADRYIVDYMQRNAVVDFSKEPPALPEVFLIKGGERHLGPPAPTSTNGTNGHTPSFKAGLRGPFKTAYVVLQDVAKATSGLHTQLLGMNSPDAIVKLASDLSIYEHSYWGRYGTDGWEFDVDAVRRILGEVEARLKKAQFRPAQA